MRGDNYVEFLTENLPDVLEDLPLHVRETMWFQHDGAPPHSSRRAKQYLDITFPNSWIGRGGPVVWPARSSNFNPLDYFLWGHLKNLIYQNPVESLEDLEKQLYNAIATITSKMVQRAQDNLLRRANMCIQMDGLHFEHML
ncbi:uncharacterized protein LOC109863516 [Pseudomyrmex gracilis]|uniref:uncharacterized protein LOC109863516 n=1 Tax=Pseudomyrmex gracilis TaxID=219809 RepID=UPI000994CB93|nr:uncharacterized protein LOC109863516 [Pseudomyrmex gracilis]